jgi:hypothetical protein
MTWKTAHEEKESFCLIWLSKRCIFRCPISSFQLTIANFLFLLDINSIRYIRMHSTIIILIDHYYGYKLYQNNEKLNLLFSILQIISLVWPSEYLSMHDTYRFKMILFVYYHNDQLLNIVLHNQVLIGVIVHWLIPFIASKGQEVSG